MLDPYQKSLQKLHKEQLYRSLRNSDVISSTRIARGDKNLISFCSNDYFSLSQNNLLKKAAIDAINQYGVGAGASRYITGNNSLYQKVEKQVASIKNCDDAIVFSSGYAAAIGVIPALVDKYDLIIADRLIHSSLIDGAKLSAARLMRFRHNDIKHAWQILQDNRQQFKRCLIITETVFSMDGDQGKVSELLDLAKKFDSLLLSDAAHDLFLKKPHNHKNYLQLGTLSKAVGSLGGYVAGNSELIDYLRNFAKSAIYSTALPPAILAASLTSLQIIGKSNLGEKAFQNAQYFCDLMNLEKPQSAIVPIIIGDNKKTLQIAKKIEEEGFLISAIRPPTVEKGKARLRITFSVSHSKKEIKALAAILTLCLA